MTPYSTFQEFQNDIFSQANRIYEKGNFPFKDDEILGLVMMSHDLRQLLISTDLDTKLVTLDESSWSSEELFDKFQSTHDQEIALRSFWILVFELSDINLSDLAVFFSFDKNQLERLEGLLDIYRNAAQRLPDSPKLDIHDSDETVLATIDRRDVEEFLDHLPVDQSEDGTLATITDTDDYGEEEKSNPIDSIFPIQRFEESLRMGDTNLLLPNKMVEFFYDDSRYDNIISGYEDTNQPFLADVARIFKYYGRIIHGISNGEDLIITFSDDVRIVLERFEKYAQTDLAVFGEMQEIVIVFKGCLNLIMGLQTVFPPATRFDFLERAENSFETSENTMFQAYGPMLRWMRAQLLEGVERERLELSAFGRVNELLAKAVLEKEPITRLGSMSMLVGMPASWKMDKGDFVGAIESATMARSIAQAFVDTCRQEIMPFIQEIEIGLSDSNYPEEERNQMILLRDTYLGMVESTQGMVVSMDLLSMVSQAKLAEMRYDFTEAHRLYQDASQLEKEVISSMRTMLMAFFKVTTAVSSEYQAGFSHEARASYFHGMALLNHGDQSLRETDFITANERYIGARQAFEDASNLWNQENDRLPETQVQPREMARQEANLNRMRTRYCDAKIEVAAASQYSSLGQHWEAAKRYQKAAGIFSELISVSVLQESTRNLDVLKASEDYCLGRALMETDLELHGKDNLVDGREHLNEAQARFDQIDERNWARYIEALRHEYEAIILWQVVQRNPTVESRELQQYAQREADEAVRVYRLAGLESHARRLEGRAKAARQSDHLSLFLPLPKPVDMPGGARSSTETTLNALNPTKQSQMSEVEAKQKYEQEWLQARADALRGTLDQLKQRLKNGRIDEGRYADLATSVETDLNIVLKDIERLSKE